MALSCEQFLERLDELEALDASDMREHAASCASCRLALSRWQAAAGQLRAWSEEPPPPFLHTRLMAELRAANEAGAVRRRAWLAWRPLWISAAVAAALVVVGVGLTVFRAPSLVDEGTGAGPGRVAPLAPQAAPPAGVALPPRAEEEQRRDAGAPARPEGPLRQRREATSAKLAQPPSAPADMGFDEAAPQKADSSVAAEPERSAPAPQVREAPAVEGGMSAQASRAGGPVRHGAQQEAAPAPAASAALGMTDGFRSGRTAARVLVRLVPMAGGPARSVELTAALVSKVTQLDVDAEGRLRPVAAPAAVRRLAESEDHERKEKAAQVLDLDPSDRATLAALALPAGRYRIEAVQP